MEKLAKLFGSAHRLKALRLFLFNENVAYTASDVSERAKISKEATRQEIADLLAVGIIRKKGTKAPYHYQADSHYEYFDALQIFIRDTTNVQPKQILTSLKRAGALQVVVLSGLFTSTIEPKIDLLVVGEHIDDRAMAKAVHTLEAELGREIRYATFAPTDFRYRVSVYDRLVRDVFDYPHRTLIDKIGI